MIANYETQTPMLSETYIGARQTLVGRQDVLPSILEAIQRQGTTSILYFTGEGGVGKTKLIQHALDLVKDEPTLLVANDLIDLYHTRNRSIGGLIESMLDVVGEIGNYIKSRPDQGAVDDQLDALARAEQEGLSTNELVTRRKGLTESLMVVFNRFTKDRRLVLALDTAERLFVARDVAQQVLGLTEERPAILDWLLQDFLPNIQNAVILVAGRPKPLNLSENLKAITKQNGQQFLEFRLRGLSEAEALEYFAAVAQPTKESQSAFEQNAAQAIRGLSLDEQRAIFYCLCDDESEPRIRPILLALAIDHLVVAGHPLSLLTLSLPEAKKLSRQKRKAIEDELGQALVKSLHEFHRPADELIITLGWLRKGTDAALLAKLLELPTVEVEAAIAQIRNLSFVKIRPSDQRIFLHDEMYELLQRNVLDQLFSEKERVFTTLQEHYRESIRMARQSITKLYQPQAATFGETLPDPAEIRAARTALQDAIIDDFYYRLHWNATSAFEQYIIYATEALVGGDESLWVLLRAELFGFLAEVDPREQNTEIAGLRRSDVVADSSVRWLMWLGTHERFEDALTMTEKIAQHAEEIIDPGGHIAWAHFLAWRGLFNVYAGKYDMAEGFLNQALTHHKEWSTQNQNRRGLRSAGVLARIYNSLGYLYSWQTHHYKAIDAFARAVQYWTQVGLAIEEANSINNRAFDLGKIGRFDVALPLAYAALKIREALGPRNPVGLSINTIALIELAQYDFSGSLRDSQRAFVVFERINSLRGIGLALLARAEGKRRTSVSATHVQQGQSAQFLAEALVDAERADEIFTETIKEPAHKIEALREIGRVYRDWAKLRREQPNLIAKEEEPHKKYTVDWLAEQSQSAFTKAIALTKDNLYVQIDLLLSQAKLHYYKILFVDDVLYPQKQMQMEKETLDPIEKLIPEEYRLPPRQDAKLPKTWSLVQSGGLAHLRGHLAYRRWLLNQQDLQWLGEAIRQYTFSLASYYYFSSDTFLEMRETQDQIFEQLNLLTQKQRHQTFQFVSETEEIYGLGVGSSAMSKFLENRFGLLVDFDYEI